MNHMSAMFAKTTQEQAQEIARDAIERARTRCAPFLRASGGDEFYKKESQGALEWALLCFDRNQFESAALSAADAVADAVKAHNSVGDGRKAHEYERQKIRLKLSEFVQTFPFVITGSDIVKHDEERWVKNINDPR